MEVRYGGVDILADPGTYCYHGEPEWRSYFQSTIAHNTVEVGGRWQSVARRRVPVAAARGRPRELDVTDDGRGQLDRPSTTVTGAQPGCRHRRSVRLDREARAIEITDEIDGGGHDVRIAFHLGPEVLADAR